MVIVQSANTRPLIMSIARQLRVRGETILPIIEMHCGVTC